MEFPYLRKVSSALQVKHGEQVLDAGQAASVVPSQHEVQKGPEVHLVRIALGPARLVGDQVFLIHSIKEEGGKGSYGVPAAAGHAVFEQAKAQSEW